MSNGKGDTPRPLSVDQTTFKENWERAFGRKKEMCQYSDLPSVNSYSDELQLELDLVKQRLTAQQETKDLLSTLEG